MSELITIINEFVLNYGYIGAFVGSLLGNLTVVIPTPYAFIITAFGTSLNPTILGFVCGIGATIGELFAYGIGYAGRRALNEEQKRRIESVKKLLEKYGAWILIVFAVTPLPDDLIIVPMGIMKYPLKSIITTVWIGKTILALILAYAGFYGVEYFNTAYTTYGTIGITISLILLIAIVIAMLKIDWDKIADRI